MSAPDSVIVVRLHAEGGLHARVALDSPLPHAVSVRDGALVTDGYAAWHAYPGYYRSGEGQLLYDPARGIHFRTVVTVRGEGGSVRAEDGELLLDGCREATLLVVNATSFNGFDKDPVKEGKPYKDLADANLAHARSLGFARLRARQEADYREFFDRVSIDLGATPDSVRVLPTDVQLLRYTDLNEANPELEALYYQYGRYLLISSPKLEVVSPTE